VRPTSDSLEVDQVTTLDVAQAILTAAHWIHFDLETSAGRLDNHSLGVSRQDRETTRGIIRLTSAHAPVRQTIIAESRGLLIAISTLCA